VSPRASLNVVVKKILSSLLGIEHQFPTHSLVMSYSDSGKY